MENEFKVGDRVRSLDYLDVGEGIIESLPSAVNACYRVYYKGESGWPEYAHEMELIGDQMGITNADMPDFVEAVTNLADGPDMVNRPPHYTSYKGFEVIDIVEQLDYLRGTAVKYIMRAGSKWNEVADLEKAIWYLQRKIEKLSKES